MKILLAIIILIIATQAAFHITKFKANKSIQKIHQITSKLILGVSIHTFTLYDLKGNVVKSIDTPHQAEIVEIDTIDLTGEFLLFTADRNGTIFLWDKDFLIIKSLDLKKQIIGAKIGIKQQKLLLLVNEGDQVRIYQQIFLKLVRIVRAQQQTYFKGVFFTKNSQIITLIQSPNYYSVNEYHYITNSFNQLLKTDKPIKQITYSISNQPERYIFLIDQSNQLIVYQSADFDHEIWIEQQAFKLSVDKGNYNLIISMQNFNGSAITAAVRSEIFIHVFLGIEKNLFLQFSQPIQQLSQGFNSSILCFTRGNTVIIIDFFEKEQGFIEFPLILVLLGLMFAGCYLCCGDMLPGVYRQWRQKREKQQIEMALYKQRSELDNF